MKNEDLCDLIFRKNFTFGRRTSKFAKENPKIAPTPWKGKKKEKKIQNANIIVFFLFIYFFTLIFNF